ncbi:unnamed protein product [Gongylonema pulchrum]|uniref:ZP domain-containing protein n=1 Tax=Gongylonema pulchrum TaxID=637853 RepID=A0A183DHP6_9BILA|nr:unnamed protein product [Gongylonema pulchrum]
MAGQEAHVYKYADRSQLFYQCQITITIKEPQTECARPSCPEPQGFASRKPSNTPSFPFSSAKALNSIRANARTIRLLKKRSAAVQDNYNTMDVRTDLNTIDIITEQPLR